MSNCSHNKNRKDCVIALQLIIYLRDKRPSEAEARLIGEIDFCQECKTHFEITREWLYEIEIIPDNES